MDPATLRLAETIFSEVVDLPAEQRAARIAHLAAARPDVIKLVASLLESDQAAGAFLQTPASGPMPARSSDTPRRIGEYQIERLIGEGGMGAVYQAWQSSPRRRVALKVMRTGIPSREMIARFRREAHVLGLLRHPGIAAVYEAGSARIEYDDGSGPEHPFISMELVDGVTLAEYTASGAGGHRHDDRHILELFARICDAVDHAHAQGVVHRDLKPSNVLVDATGAPKVLDFGVARAAAAEPGASIHTDTGRLIGTIAYMSPEQVDADQSRIDRRSDIYALGVMLYEVLAGRPPHQVRDLPLATAARVIREDEPSRLGSINTSLRGDIETIVAKAIDKSPARRYQSAAEMAADIRRHLRDEPITARPASATYQLRKFARRNRAIVGGVVGTFLALVAGLVGMAILAAQEKSQRLTAEENARVAERRAYRASLSAAQSALRTDDARLAAQYLQESPATLRGWEWQYLSIAADTAGVEPTLLAPDEKCRGFSADGVWGVVESPTDIRVQRIGSQEVVGHIPRQREFRSAKASLDGRRLMLTGSNRKIDVWDVVHGARLCSLDDQSNRWLPNLSDDGSLVALPVDADQSTRIVDVDTSATRVVLAAHATTPTPLFDSATRLCAVSYHGDPSQTVLFDLATGRELWRRPGVAHAFSPAGDRLVIELSDNLKAYVIAVDVKDGSEQTRLPIGEVSLWSSPLAVIRPDGAIIAAEDRPGAIALWDARSLERLGTVHAPSNVGQIRYRSDDMALLGLSDQLRLYLWPAQVGRAEWSIAKFQTGAVATSFHPATDRCARADWGSVSVWDTTTGELLWRRCLGTRHSRAVAFSPDGQRVAADTGNGHVAVFSILGDRLTADQPTPAPFEITSFLWTSPSVLAIGRTDGSIDWVDPERPQQLLRTSRVFTSAVSSLALSVDGSTVAAASDGSGKRNRDTDPAPSPTPDPAVRLLRASTGEIIRDLGRQPAPVRSLALSSDGASIAWGLASGQVFSASLIQPEADRAYIGAASSVDALAFSPDSNRLVGLGHDGKAVLWDVDAPEALLWLNVGPEARYAAITFSRDGGAIVAARDDAVVIFHATASSPEVIARRDLVRRSRSVAERALRPTRIAEDAAAAIGADASLSADIRNQAISLVTAARDLASLLNSEAWGKVVRPGDPVSSYDLALRKASHAAAQLPDHAGVLNTLAVAQLRAGKHEDAFSTIAHIERLCSEHAIPMSPVDLAVGAMAAHRLNRHDAALAYLQRAQTMMADPSQASDLEAKQFVAEATSALSPHR